MRRWWRLIVAATIAATVAAACGDDEPPATTYTLTGLVQAGPTCPVEQPGQECPPAPVRGRVEVRLDGRVVADTTTDAAGRFTVEVPAGSYTVVVDTGAALPICPSQTVTVESGPASIVIDCDTGIR